MKIEDIRAKNDGELETELMALKKEQLNLRFQRATGQIENTARQINGCALLINLYGPSPRANLANWTSS